MPTIVSRFPLVYVPWIGLVNDALARIGSAPSQRQADRERAAFAKPTGNVDCPCVPIDTSQSELRKTKS